MKRKIILTLTLALILAMPHAALAQGNRVKANHRILYHNGPVLAGTTPVYLIFYGCWDCGYAGSDVGTQAVLADLIANLGLSSYFLINAGYPDATGATPNGALVFSGSVADSYSRGNILTAADVQAIITDKFDHGTLPAPPGAVYIIVASSDVSANATGFCAAGTPPLHGTYSYFGQPIQYAFIGNAARCPTVAAPQFMATDGTFLPTPNNNLAADAMASTMARALNGLVTNPTGSGWYDRYGLENGDKCAGTFGATYTTGNGARANMRLGSRDFLIQQNWINSSRGYCALSYLQ